MTITNTTKASIAKIDNQSYHSFFAYTRPKRVESDYRRSAQAKVINLDPTDNPDEVCNAYRQIRIKQQLKRIAKNEARMAEKRAKAEAEAAKAEAKIEERARARAAAQLKWQMNSTSTKRREMMVEKMEAGQYLVAPTQTSARNATSLDICTIRQMTGKDVVSVTSVGITDPTGVILLSVWGMDTFKRTKGKYKAAVITKQQPLKDLLLEILSNGYLLTYDDVSAGNSTIKRAIASIRKDGHVVCIVKNIGIDTEPRGWVIPSEKNGLVESNFFESGHGAKK